jgi:hypothetical protein
MFETRNKSNVKGVYIAVTRGWWMALSVLLLQVYACSSRTTVDTAGESGALSLPLTYESASGRYRLAASFLLFDHEVTPDTAETPLLTLTSSGPPAPAQSELTAALPPGDYWVVVRYWQLYRGEEQAWVAIEAEPTAASTTVTIHAGETSTATFTFVTTPAPAPEAGEVTVTFEVAEGSLCGNGITEAAESCDDGLLNGFYNHCNLTCTGPTGPAPLHVAPDAPANGSGASWADPMNDLQAALDQQSDAGGGAVWVLGGRFSRLTSSGETLLDVPSNVSLLGGFSGGETAPEQRDPSYERTWLVRAEGATEFLPLLQVIDANRVLLDSIAVNEGNNNGEDPIVLIDGSRGVVLRKARLQRSEGYWSRISFSQAEVRVEHSDINLTGVYFVVNETDLSILDSTLSGGSVPYASFGGGYLSTVDSRVLLQDVVSDRPLGFGTDTKVLLNRTVVRDRFDRTNMIRSVGELTLVGSALLDTRTGNAPITATSLFVFDSTFANLQAATIGGNYSSAAAIDADSVEVALSTFFQARCGGVPHPPGSCLVPVVIRNEGLVHNTLFAGHEHETPGPYPLAPYEGSVNPSDKQAANCATFDTSAFERSSVVSDQVLALEHPCVDAGDAALLEGSRQRLFERVAEFLQPPFNADLARYQDPDFWRHSTVRSDTPEDTGAPDPGRHWEVAAP